MSVFDGLRFRKVHSPIHNLDPRIKFVYVIAIFVVAIIFYQIIPLLVLFFMQIPFVLLARVQRQWLRSLRGAAFLAIFIFVVNVGTTYFTSGYHLTAFNVENAAAMTLRFVVLVESFSVFFLTTSPDHLGLALEESRVPYEFAFAFTTAVRFVPVLAEEAQTIMDAQKARGLELEKGGLLKRIRNYVPVLIPLDCQCDSQELGVGGGNGVAGLGRHKETHQPLPAQAAQRRLCFVGYHCRNPSHSGLCALLCVDSNNNPVSLKHGDYPNCRSISR